jgi:hypothetical protein
MPTRASCEGVFVILSEAKNPASTDIFIRSVGSFAALRMTDLPAAASAKKQSPQQVRALVAS